MLIPRKIKNVWLLFSSLIFYSWAEPKVIIVLLGSSILSFFLVTRMNQQDNKIRKRYLIGLITFNLLLLFYFKYTNFFLSNLNSCLQNFHLDELKWQEVILPIGISFFIFQSITYIVDVYRKETEPQRYIHNYLLYIFFFPQLIAGPIVKYKHIANQFTQRIESSQLFLSGFVRFTIGLAKKVLLANVLGECAEVMFGSTSLNSYHIWMGTLCYTFQIYFDFSAYSDMAIGLGKMFGFHFPENFDRPYTSYSITQFWKKWHITLGDFMKNYLYIPLGGNRVENWKIYRNLLLVFLLSGLWHGDNWTFILWGLYHGFWLILERIFLQNIFVRIKIIAIPFTFFIVLISWVLFRATDVHEAMKHVSIMFDFHTFQYDSYQNSFYFNFHLTAAVLICLFGFSRRMRDFSDFFVRQHTQTIYQLTTTLTAVFIFVLCVASVISTDFNPFIYFKF